MGAMECLTGKRVLYEASESKKGKRLLQPQEEKKEITPPVQPLYRGGKTEDPGSTLDMYKKRVYGKQEQFTKKPQNGRKKTPLERQEK